MHLWGYLNRHLWFLLERRKNSQSKVGVRLNKSPYSEAMWDLFLYEFCSPGTYSLPEEIVLETIAATRRRAAIAAYCQQAAMQCYRGVRLSNQAVLTEEVSPSNDAIQQICSFAASNPSYPRTLQRRPLLRTYPWLDPDASISQRHLMWAQKDEHSLAGWPEYLWDTEQRYAVPTKSFGGEKPAYIAISHTWGR